MRIIKGGMDREWEIECKWCKSLIAYQLNDIFTETGVNTYNEYSEHDCIECPVCKEHLVIIKKTLWNNAIK